VLLMREGVAGWIVHVHAAPPAPSMAVGSPGRDDRRGLPAAPRSIVDDGLRDPLVAVLANMVMNHSREESA
jgi:hypothetical protein